MDRETDSDEMNNDQHKMKRKEHYVPRFYLKNFSGKNDQIFAYNIDESKVYSTNTYDLCVQKDLYESKYISPEGHAFIQPNKVENGLANLEAGFASLVRGIVDSNNTNHQGGESVLDNTRKKEIAQFAAHLFIRNPWFLNKFVNSEYGMTYMQKLMENDEELRKRIEYHDSTGIPAEPIAKSATLSVLFDSLSALCIKNFKAMKSSIIIAPANTEFITSNCPVLFNLLDNADGSMSLERAFLPLSPQIGIMFSGNDCADRSKLHGIVNGSIVDSLNTNFIMLEAVEILISNNKAILECIKTSWEASPHRRVE